MRILFITPYVPSPIRFRSYNLLRQLSARHDVVALALCQGSREPDDLLALRSICPAVGVSLSRAEAALNCLRAVPSRVPLQGAYCRSPELESLVRAALTDPTRQPRAIPPELLGPFDVVHVEHLRAGYVSSFIQPEMPMVYDSVDCISLLLARTLRASLSPRQRLLAMLEIGRVRSYEGKLLRRFDRTAVTSPSDAAALRALAPDASITVVPIGVDLEYFSPSPRQPEPETLVLSGKMSYHANATAALHFVRNILPRIRAVRPGVRLTIAGSDPGREVRNLARDPAITVTGHVPDIREALARATVAICPVTVKVGIQSKALEAMAMGRSVVCTREGLEGLQAKAGRDLLMGETAAEFAEHVCQLLDDPALRDRVGQAGRRYVETHHRWETVASHLANLYQETIDIKSQALGQIRAADHRR
ncbi:MAG TPA: glycosyltransferase family 4 protein [Chloroflexota bacterium]|nr:glycosyltransferase family 4 protein [Chloroflexota bacterium]